MLTPREAVLNRNAAEMAGRGNIERLNREGNLLAEKGVDLAARGDAKVDDEQEYYRDFNRRLDKRRKEFRNVPGPQFDPFEVPVFPGERGRYYDPRYGREDLRLMAEGGEKNVKKEAKKLQGGVTNLGKNRRLGEPPGAYGRGGGGVPMPERQGGPLGGNVASGSPYAAGFNAMEGEARGRGMLGRGGGGAGLGGGATGAMPLRGGGGVAVPPPGAFGPIGGGVSSQAGGGAYNLGPPVGGPGLGQGGGVTNWMGGGGGLGAGYDAYLGPPVLGGGGGNVGYGGGNLTYGGGGPGLGGGATGFSGGYSGGAGLGGGYPAGARGLYNLEQLKRMPSASFYGGQGFAAGSTDVHEIGDYSGNQVAYGPPINLSAPDILKALQKAGKEEGLSSGQIAGLTKAFQGMGQGYGAASAGVGFGDYYGEGSATSQALGPALEGAFGGGYQGGISDIGYPPMIAPRAQYHADKGSNWIGPYDPNYTIPVYQRGEEDVPFGPGYTNDPLTGGGWTSLDPTNRTDLGNWAASRYLYGPRWAQEGGDPQTSRTYGYGGGPGAMTQGPFTPGTTFFSPGGAMTTIAPSGYPRAIPVNIPMNTGPDVYAISKGGPGHRVTA